MNMQDSPQWRHVEVEPWHQGQPQPLQPEHLYAPLRREDEFPHTAACTANRCASGRSACPCPQTCQLPEASTASRLLAMAARVQPHHFWRGTLLCLGLGYGALALWIWG